MHDPILLFLHALIIFHHKDSPLMNGFKIQDSFVGGPKGWDTGNKLQKVARD